MQQGYNYVQGGYPIRVLGWQSCQCMNNKAEMQTSESGFGRSTSAVGTRLTAIFNVIGI